MRPGPFIRPSAQCATAQDGIRSTVGLIGAAYTGPSIVRSPRPPPVPPGSLCSKMVGALAPAGMVSMGEEIGSDFGGWRALSSSPQPHSASSPLDG